MLFSLKQEAFASVGVGTFTGVKIFIHKIIKVITFGWNSGGIGKKYGFEIIRILLVPHGGWHNDTICTVEVKNG